VAVVLVVGLGLLWRSELMPLPRFFVKYGGVALWALMVFLGLGVAFPRTPTVRLAGIAGCIAWCVEFLQLYHATWIDAVRSTQLGNLVLGTTFHWPDLVAYLVGIVGGAAMESACLRLGFASVKDHPSKNETNHPME
jgi:hypothetical protein